MPIFQGNPSNPQPDVLIIRGDRPSLQLVKEKLGPEFRCLEVGANSSEIRRALEGGHFKIVIIAGGSPEAIESLIAYIDYLDNSLPLRVVSADPLLEIGNLSPAHPRVGFYRRAAQTLLDEKGIAQNLATVARNLFQALIPN